MTLDGILFCLGLRHVLGNDDDDDDEDSEPVISSIADELVFSIGLSSRININLLKHNL